ncbi:MAG: hypothetical protein NXH95_02535 [Pseudomonadaceae bacterium]|nr:hypothetical protein [Pseudomonadaceae bacterium]
MAKLPYGEQEFAPYEDNVFVREKSRRNRASAQPYIEESPCDKCWNAHRCGSMGLACSLYTHWVHKGNIPTETEKCNRDDASPARYDLIFSGSHKDELDYGSTDVHWDQLA